jgi:hypothetical protein
MLARADDRDRERAYRWLAGKKLLVGDSPRLAETLKPILDGGVLLGPLSWYLAVKFVRNGFYEGMSIASRKGPKG